MARGEPVSIEELTETAVRAADAAGGVLRGFFRGDFALEKKDAASPVVTEADRQSERTIREVISARFPDHAIVGEEFGGSPGDGTLTWHIDPIDGTIAFSCGRPQFVILIAAADSEGPLVGLIDQPVTGERWIGGRGLETTLNGVVCRTSGITELANCRLGTTDPALFPDRADAAWFDRLRGACRLTSLGGDGYNYGLVALGSLDLVVESGLAWHDAAALIPVVEGAGGVMTDFSGNALVPDQPVYDVIAAATPELHAAALKLRDPSAQE